MEWFSKKSCTRSGNFFLPKSFMYTRRPALRRLANSLVHGLGHIFHVARVQARHTDPPILGAVDVCILSDLQDLFFRQAGEAEHADLVGDMLPTAFLAVQLLQLRPQRSPHINDPAGHRPEVGFPLLEQRRVVEHRARDPRAVRGRVADLASLQDRELGGNARNGVGGIGAGAGHEVESTRALTVEPEVLGE